MTVGASPANADQLNAQVGVLCRNFVNIQSLVHQQWAWLSAEDLTQPPYAMTAEDQTTIKSALGPLDTSLQAVDMTFIARLIGLPT